MSKGYLRKSLGEGESIRYIARRHWISYLGSLVILALSLLSFLSAATSKGENSAGFGAVGVTCVLVGLVVLFDSWIRNKTTELAVTNRKVIAKWGFVARKTIEQRLEKVDSVQVDQGIFGRILDYGTIIVHGSGSSTTPIRTIANPIEFRRQVENAVTQLSGQGRG